MDEQVLKRIADSMIDFVASEKASDGTCGYVDEPILAENEQLIRDSKQKFVVNYYKKRLNEGKLHTQLFLKDYQITSPDESIYPLDLLVKFDPDDIPDVHKRMALLRDDTQQWFDDKVTEFSALLKKRNEQYASELEVLLREMLSNGSTTALRN